MVTLQSRRTAQAFSADLLRFVTTAAASVSFAAEALHGIPSTPADERDELAIQCNQCGRIEAWRPEAGRCPCGGLYTPSALPKTLFNRFDLETVLGSGGMGVVYLAMDSELHRRVAIKTLPTLTMTAADRLMSEARVMAALSHGHIAVLYGTGTWQQTPVLMMEYLSGGTLATRVKEGPVSLAAAVHMTIRSRHRSRTRPPGGLVSRRHQTEQHRLHRVRVSQVPRLWPEPRVRGWPDGVGRHTAVSLT